MDSTIPENYVIQNEEETKKYPLLSNTYKIIDSNYICFNNYVIGSGSFGKVLYSININQTQEFAIKFEKPSVKNSVLEEELNIYKNVYSDKVEGIPKVYWYGEYKKYKIMVMDLLGPSLDKFYKVFNKQFSIDTAVNLGYQMINRIEHVHKMGYVHRDIKPNNFLLGKFNRICSDDLVYIIDFGLSKDYLCPETGKHYEFSDNKRFVGTPRYASLNTHLGFKQSRRDDVESIIYVLIYFIKGELPWQGVKAKTKSEKKEKIKKKKKSVSVEKLCEGIPFEFVEMLNHVKQLEFKQTPDYDLYRKLLNLTYEKYKQFDNFVWDWESLFLMTQEYPQMHTTNRSKYEKLYEGYPIPDFDSYLEELIKRKSHIKQLNGESLYKVGVKKIPNNNNGTFGLVNESLPSTVVRSEMVINKMDKNNKNSDDEMIDLEIKNKDNNKIINSYFKTANFDVDMENDVEMKEDKKVFKLEKKVTKK
jgi:serine/threonine protein kinase